MCFNDCYPNAVRGELVQVQMFGTIGSLLKEWESVWEQVTNGGKGNTKSLHFLT